MTQLEHQLMSSLEDLIRARDSQIKWFDKFIDDMWGHEVGVNSAKTVTTVGTVAGTVLLFTPFVAVGVGVLVASGVGGLGTTAGDLIANKVKDGSIREVADQGKEEERQMQACLAKVNKMAEGIRKQCRCTEEESVSVALAILKGLGGMQGDVTKIVQSLPFITNVLAAIRAGASLKSAASVAITTTRVATTGVRASVCLTEGLAASAEGAALAGRVVAPAEGLVTAGASVASKAALSVAVIGSVVSVADCIYSWSTNNPTKESAIQGREHLSKSREGLQDLLKLLQ